MKFKAQKLRLNRNQLCLVFLLLISGVSQIWAQSEPDSSEKKTPKPAIKTDVLKTPGNTEKRFDQTKKIPVEESLRAKVEAEEKLKQDKQLPRERDKFNGNQSSEVSPAENNLTIEVFEDIAEYQSIQEPVVEKKMEIPVASKIENRKITMVGKPLISNQTAPSPVSGPCNWERINSDLRDPFDAQSRECMHLLDLARDPFQRPLAEVTVYGNEITQQQFYPAFEIQNFSAKRSNAGFDPQWIDWILTYAAAENVDPLLVLEVMRWESSFKPGAVSYVGAAGLMQFMPATARRFGINPFDERQAIFGGSRYLGFLLRRFNGNIRSALAGYNAGEGAVDAFLNCRSIRAGSKVINPLGRCTVDGIPPYAETQKYAAGIYANYQTSVRRAAGIVDSRQRIAVNVRFKFTNLEAVGIQGQNKTDDRN